jgi:hypothetical protein
MSCTSSGHITKLEQSIFAPFDIYGSTHLRHPKRPREVQPQYMSHAVLPYTLAVSMPLREKDKNNIRKVFFSNLKLLEVRSSFDQTKDCFFALNPKYSNLN